VRGACERDALRGLGHCHARDRVLQMVLARVIGRGRAAEVLAGSSELVRLDAQFRRLDLGRGAGAEVARLSAGHRALLDAYCIGVSEVLRARVPWELRLLRHRPEPWTPEDVILMARLMGYVGLAQTQGDIERLIVELVHAGVRDSLLRELFPGRLTMLDRELVRSVTLGERVLPLTASAGVPSMAGSNAWAVSPGRTADGAALLAGDPHLEVSRLPAVWYEAVLDYGDGWCAGATMPGLPGVIIGRNADVAWSATYGTGDAIDSWVEEVRDGRYLRTVDGEDVWLPFRRRDEVIRRRGGTPVTKPVFENDHGVLDGDPRSPGRYLATRWASGEGTGARSLAATFDLMRARDVGAACALGQLEFSFVWVIADRHGSIAKVMSGRIPRRRNADAGAVPLPGWDPQHDWDGFLDPEDLPREVDPADGFIAAANEDVNHLADATVVTLAMPPYRARRIAELLMTRHDWTVTDFQHMQMDCVSPQAQRFLEVLRPLLADDRRFDTLLRWDGTYEDDSQAAAWFDAFYRALIEEALTRACGAAGRFLIEETAFVAAHFGLLDDVLLNPDSAWHDQDGRDAALRRAANSALATLPSKLRDRQPLVMRHILLHGRAPSWLGFDHAQLSLRGGRATIHQSQTLRSGGRKFSVGPSFRMVTNLADAAIHTTLPGGPSDRRFSRWYDSGVADWWSGTFKTVSRREAVRGGDHGLVEP
jgi:penicillin amidase